MMVVAIFGSSIRTAGPAAGIRVITRRDLVKTYKRTLPSADTETMAARDGRRMLVAVEAALAKWVALLCRVSTKRREEMVLTSQICSPTILAKMGGSPAAVVEQIAQERVHLLVVEAVGETVTITPRATILDPRRFRTPAGEVEVI
jgi:hypothetical protein